MPGFAGLAGTMGKSRRELASATCRRHSADAPSAASLAGSPSMQSGGLGCGRSCSGSRRRWRAGSGKRRTPWRFLRRHHPPRDQTTAASLRRFIPKARATACWLMERVVRSVRTGRRIRSPARPPSPLPSLSTPTVAELASSQPTVPSRARPLLRMMKAMTVALSPGPSPARGRGEIRQSLARPSR